MRILVVDGQGGMIGKMLIEQLKATIPQIDITAVGTNSMATAAMIKAGADNAATGENPVIVSAKRADIIVGPIGIVLANALLGEITPAMATAVGASDAQKILIPVNRCHCNVAGVQQMSLTDYIRHAVDSIKELIS